jgi:aspartate/methionine/tyrosine aminotransferase
MRIPTFELERYFAKHEFSARYLLSSSDCQALELSELLEMATPETRELWQSLNLGYTEYQGHPLLRREIAELYPGLGTDDIQVVVPEEGIFLFMNAVLKPGDHVVCTFPGYQSLYQIARSLGCEVSTWEPHESKGWFFDPDDLGTLLTHNTRLVVVNFPHNPTGALPTVAQYRDVAERVRRTGAYLFSDEMYRYLEHEEEDTLPSGCEVYERGITLSGLSKSFGLPGLRTGWLAARDRDVLRRVSLLKDYITICHSAPSEILALIALQSRQEITGCQRQRVRKNLELLEDFVDEHSHLFTWNRPRGGPICLVKAKEERVPDTLAFCQRLVRETGIMLVPSVMFQYGSHHVRFGFGRDNLPQALDALGDYLA